MRTANKVEISNRQANAPMGLSPCWEVSVGVKKKTKKTQNEKKDVRLSVDQTPVDGKDKTCKVLHCVVFAWTMSIYTQLNVYMWM